MYEKHFKRLLDLFIAVAALVGLAPLFVLVALLVKTSRGPVFYSQDRVGKDGKFFRLYKFRTMVVNADAMRASLAALNHRDGPAFKVRNDPRVTMVGRVLRKTAVDELPQLLNVLKGEMSCVGPRPHLPPETEAYEEKHWGRSAVLPGLTCFWQVAPDRERWSFEQWIESDLEYVQQVSFWLDCKIMLKTAAFLVLGRHEA